MRAVSEPDNDPMKRPEAPPAIGKEPVVSGIGQKARDRLASALDWLPKPGTDGPGETRTGFSPGATREALLKSLSERYGYPIIGGDSDTKALSKELVVGHNPFGEAAEAIRSIRSEIASAALAQGKRSIMVVAPRSGAGATYLVGNLAVAFAQMGIPTLLVDTNLRRPRLAQVFGLPPDTEGLAELVLRKHFDQSPIHHNIIPGLSLLTAGAIPPNPQEILASPEFLALSNNFQNHFGLVLYDTAPGLDYADALVVGSRIGAAIMVARQHRTHWQDAAQLSKKFASIKCLLVGSVLNTN